MYRPPLVPMKRVGASRANYIPRMFWGQCRHLPFISGAHSFFCSQPAVSLVGAGTEPNTGRTSSELQSLDIEPPARKSHYSASDSTCIPSRKPSSWHSITTPPRSRVCPGHPEVYIRALHFGVGHRTGLVSATGHHRSLQDHQPWPWSLKTHPGLDSAYSLLLGCAIALACHHHTIPKGPCNYMAILYLGPERVPTSLIWGLCTYYYDTWTLWEWLQRCSRVTEEIPGAWRANGGNLTSPSQ